MGKEQTFIRDRIPHYDSPTAVGQRVSEARTAAGLSQRELSFPGCSGAYISRIERGERVPSLQVMGEIAKRTGVSTSYLAYGDSGIDAQVALAFERASRAANERLDDLADAYKALASAARRAANNV